MEVNCHSIWNFIGYLSVTNLQPALNMCTGGSQTSAVLKECAGVIKLQVSKDY